MSTVLYDLYYGRISPWEHRPVSNQEDQILERRIADEKRYFAQIMSPDDFRRFQDMEDLYMQSGDSEQLDAFSCGFKLGIKLMASVFAEND